MSEQKKSYTVSQEDMATIHSLLDKAMQGEGVQGVMVLCCAFTQDNTQAMTCVTGTMSMDDVLHGIARCGSKLLEQMELQGAKTPPSGVWQ